MTEMAEKEGKGAKIRKGLGPKRSSTSYQVVRDIVIPAGTILRDYGDGGKDFEVFSALLDLYAEIRIKLVRGEKVDSDKFKAVISS